MSLNLEATLGVLENRFDLFSRYTGKPGEKVIYASAAFEILKERGYRNSRAAKCPYAAYSARIAFNRRTCGPVQHSYKVNVESKRRQVMI